MIIAFPNDGKGRLYHIIDLNGITVHSYNDFETAMRSMEGDQRLAIYDIQHNRWLTERPAPMRDQPLITQKQAKELLELIGEYRDAEVEDSWKGGGDPADIPEVEANLKAAKTQLELFIFTITDQTRPS